MMPVHQRCPICHEWFWGSDAIGSPCDRCASSVSPGDSMVESLRKFVECEHRHWECTQCHCRTDAGTIASPWRAKVNELEKRIAELEKALLCEYCNGTGRDWDQHGVFDCRHCNAAKFMRAAKAGGEW